MAALGPGDRQTQGATGAQRTITLDNATISLSKDTQQGKVLLGQVLSTAGTYYCDVDVTGLADVEIHVRASAVSGTVTPSAYSTYVDGVTSKTAATDSGAGALAAGVRRTFTLTGLRGVRIVRLQLVVAAASSATIDQAEVNAL